jgi:hypothetical protein
MLVTPAPTPSPVLRPDEVQAIATAAGTMLIVLLLAALLILIFLLGLLLQWALTE